MKHSGYLLFLALCALPSCNNDSGVQPTLLNGAWLSVEQPPGFSIGFVLTTNGSSISGAGNWTGEAIAGGTVSVVGEFGHGNVSLDLTFKHVVNGVPQDQGQFIEHFTGAFTSHDDLEGTSTLNGQPSPLHLHRASVP